MHNLGLKVRPEWTDTGLEWQSLGPFQPKLSESGAWGGIPAQDFDRDQGQCESGWVRRGWKVIRRYKPPRGGPSMSGPRGRPGAGARLVGQTARGTGRLRRRLGGDFGRSFATVLGRSKVRRKAGKASGGSRVSYGFVLRERGLVARITGFLPRATFVLQMHGIPLAHVRQS